MELHLVNYFYEGTSGTTNISDIVLAFEIINLSMISGHTLLKD
jgi:hypothetical protein